MGWTINLNWLQPSTVGNAWGEVNWWLLHQAFLQNPPLHLRFETRGKWKSILPCKPIIFIFRGHNPYFSGVKTFIVHGNHYHPEVFEVFSKGELPCSESRWLATRNLGGDLQGAMINKTIHRSCAIDPFRVVYDDMFVSDGMVRSVVICGGTATWSEEDMSCLCWGWYFINYCTWLEYDIMCLLCSKYFGDCTSSRSVSIFTILRIN